MLYRASVRDLKEKRISRRYTYTVVVMQYYPRFLGKEWVDESVHSLAPERGLFTEFKALARDLKDHNLAFEKIGYEDRFRITAEGSEHLARLSALAVQRDVCLLCQCVAAERCHGDLLLLMAKHWYHANTSIVRHGYPRFDERLAAGDLGLSEQEEKTF